MDSHVNSVAAIRSLCQQSNKSNLLYYGDKIFLSTSAPYGLVEGRAFSDSTVWCHELAAQQVHLPGMYDSMFVVLPKLSYRAQVVYTDYKKSLQKRTGYNTVSDLDWSRSHLIQVLLALLSGTQFNDVSIQGKVGQYFKDVDEDCKVRLAKRFGSQLGKYGGFENFADLVKSQLSVNAEEGRLSGSVEITYARMEEMTLHELSRELSFSKRQGWTPGLINLLEFMFHRFVDSNISRRTAMTYLEVKYGEVAEKGMAVILQACLSAVPDEPVADCDTVESWLNAGLRRYRKYRNQPNDPSREGGVRLAEAHLFLEADAQLLEKKAEREVTKNEMEIRRLHGTPITFGSTVQFMHVASGHFLRVTHLLAELDPRSLKVDLSSPHAGGASSRASLFRIMGTVKGLSSSSRVRFGESFKLVSEAAVNHYVSLSPASIDTAKFKTIQRDVINNAYIEKSHEITASVSPGVFRAIPAGRYSNALHYNSVSGGVYVRCGIHLFIYNRTTSSHLQYDEDVISFRKGRPSSRSYFILQPYRQIVWWAERVCYQVDLVHIRHAATGLLVACRFRDPMRETDPVIFLTDDYRDPGSLWRITLSQDGGADVDDDNSGMEDDISIGGASDDGAENFMAASTVRSAVKDKKGPVMVRFRGGMFLQNEVTKKFMGAGPAIGAGRLPTTDAIERLKLSQVVAEDIGSPMHFGFVMQEDVVDFQRVMGATSVFFRYKTELEESVKWDTSRAGQEMWSRRGRAASSVQSSLLATKNVEDVIGRIYPSIVQQHLSELISRAVSSSNPDPLTRDGPAVPGFQEILMNHGVHDLLFSCLTIPFEEKDVPFPEKTAQERRQAPNDDVRRDAWYGLFMMTQRLMYRLVRAMAKSNERNATVLSEHMPTMIDHLGSKMEAARTLKELFQSPSVLNQAVSKGIISKFWDQVKGNWSYPRFLELLSGTLSHGTTPYLRNQKLVAEKLCNDDDVKQILRSVKLEITNQSLPKVASMVSVGESVKSEGGGEGTGVNDTRIESDGEKEKASHVNGEKSSFSSRNNLSSKEFEQEKPCDPLQQTETSGDTRRESLPPEALVACPPDPSLKDSAAPSPKRVMKQVSMADADPVPEPQGASSALPHYETPGGDIGPSEDNAFNESSETGTTPRDPGDLNRMSTTPDDMERKRSFGAIVRAVKRFRRALDANMGQNLIEGTEEGILHFTIPRLSGMGDMAITIQSPNVSESLIKSWMRKDIFLLSDRQRGIIFHNALIDLLANICRGRNSFCIQKVLEVTSFSFVFLLDIIFCSSIAPTIRAKYSVLLRVLFVDRDPLIEDEQLSFVKGANGENIVNENRQADAQGGFSGEYAFVDGTDHEGVVMSTEEWSALKLRIISFLRFFFENSSKVYPGEYVTYILELLELLSCMLRFGKYEVKPGQDEKDFNSELGLIFASVETVLDVYSAFDFNDTELRNSTSRLQSLGCDILSYILVLRRHFVLDKIVALYVNNRDAILKDQMRSSNRKQSTGIFKKMFSSKRNRIRVSPDSDSEHMKSHTDADVEPNKGFTADGKDACDPDNMASQNNIPYEDDGIFQSIRASVSALLASLNTKEESEMFDKLMEQSVHTQFLPLRFRTIDLVTRISLQRTAVGESLDEIILLTSADHMNTFSEYLQHRRDLRYLSVRVAVFDSGDEYNRPYEKASVIIRKLLDHLDARGVSSAEIEARRMLMMHAGIDKSVVKILETPLRTDEERNAIDIPLKNLFQLCYDFLNRVCRSKEIQERLYSYIETLFLQHVGVQDLDVTSTIVAILKNNSDLISKLPEDTFARYIGLMGEVARNPRWLRFFETVLLVKGDAVEDREKKVSDFLSNHGSLIDLVGNAVIYEKAPPKPSQQEDGQEQGVPQEKLHSIPETSPRRVYEESQEAESEKAASRKGSQSSIRLSVDTSSSAAAMQAVMESQNTQDERKNGVLFTGGEQDVSSNSGEGEPDAPDRRWSTLPSHKVDDFPTGLASMMRSIQHAESYGDVRLIRSPGKDFRRRRTVDENSVTIIPRWKLMQDQEYRKPLGSGLKYHVNCILFMARCCTGRDYTFLESIVRYLVPFDSVMQVLLGHVGQPNDVILKRDSVRYVQTAYLNLFTNAYLISRNPLAATLLNDWSNGFFSLDAYPFSHSGITKPLFVTYTEDIREYIQRVNNFDQESSDDFHFRVHSAYISEVLLFLRSYYEMYFQAQAGDYVKIEVTQDLRDALGELMENEGLLQGHQFLTVVTLYHLDRLLAAMNMYLTTGSVVTSDEDIATRIHNTPIWHEQQYDDNDDTILNEDSFINTSHYAPVRNQSFAVTFSESLDNSWRQFIKAIARRASTFGREAGIHDATHFDIKPLVDYLVNTIPRKGETLIRTLVELLFVLNQNDGAKKWTNGSEDLIDDFKQSTKLHELPFRDTCITIRNLSLGMHVLGSIVRALTGQAAGEEMMMKTNDHHERLSHRALQHLRYGQQSARTADLKRQQGVHYSQELRNVSYTMIKNVLTTINRSPLILESVGSSNDLAVSLGLRVCTLLTRDSPFSTTIKANAVDYLEYARSTQFFEGCQALLSRASKILHTYRTLRIHESESRVREMHMALLNEQKVDDKDFNTSSLPTEAKTRVLKNMIRMVGKMQKFVGKLAHCSGTNAFMHERRRALEKHRQRGLEKALKAWISVVSDVESMLELFRRLLYQVEDKPGSFSDLIRETTMHDFNISMIQELVRFLTVLTPIVVEAVETRDRSENDSVWSDDRRRVMGLFVSICNTLTRAAEGPSSSNQAFIIRVDVIELINTVLVSCTMLPSALVNSDLMAIIAASQRLLLSLLEGNNASSAAAILTSLEWPRILARRDTAAWGFMNDPSSTRKSLLMDEIVRFEALVIKVDSAILRAGGLDKIDSNDRSRLTRLLEESERRDQCRAVLAGIRCSKIAFCDRMCIFHAFQESLNVRTLLERSAGHITVVRHGIQESVMFSKYVPEESILSTVVRSKSLNKTMHAEILERYDENDQKRLQEFNKIVVLFVYMMLYEGYVLRNRRLRWTSKVEQLRKYIGVPFVMSVLVSLALILLYEGDDDVLTLSAYWTMEPQSFFIQLLCLIHFLVSIPLTAMYFLRDFPTRLFELMVAQDSFNVASSEEYVELMTQVFGSGSALLSSDIVPGIVSHTKDKKIVLSAFLRWLLTPWKAKNVQGWLLHFYILYPIMSAAALFVSPFFSAYHLIEIFRTTTTRFVMKAVYHNIARLVSTMIMFTIFVYFFVLANHFLFEDEDVCPTLFSCSLVFLNHVPQGGIIYSAVEDHYDLPSTIMDVNSEHWNSVGRLVFGIVFGLVVIVVFVAIVSGIIIDSFGELRDDHERAMKSYQNKCYICGHQRYHLDSVESGGFDYHISHWHSLYNYFDFMVHVASRSHTELSSLELFLARSLMTRSSTSMFPLMSSAVITPTRTTT